MERLLSGNAARLLRLAACAALVLLYCVISAGRIYADAGGAYFGSPGELTADLTRWLFGANEREYKANAWNCAGAAFLRRVVRDGFPIPEDWQGRLRAVRKAPPLHQLTLVNGLVNGVPYVPDKRDEWKSPRVFLKDGGDCDGSAVAKYALLWTLGFAAEDLRIVGVIIRGRRGSHAVTVVRTGPGPLQIFLLDNLSNAVRTVRYVDEYTPLISMNEEGIWLHDARGLIIAPHFVDPIIQDR
jgi:hypothetical protein